jgi:replicative DNA helicase
MPGTDAQDFERGILGVVLLDNDRLALAASLLQREHFMLDSHQQIFGAMLRLWDKRQAIDINTVAEELGGLQACQTVGGMAYVMSLTEGIYRFSEDTIRTYSERIRQAWKARQAVNVGNVLAESAMGDEEIEESIARAQQRLESIAWISKPTMLR